METPEKWADKEYTSIFRTNYYQFRKIYKANKGDTLEITTGDAFLKYIMVFGYSDMYRKSETQIESELKSLWPELQLLAEDQPIGLLTTPQEAPKRSFWDLFTPSPKKNMRVAFAYVDGTSES